MYLMVKAFLLPLAGQRLCIAGSADFDRHNCSFYKVRQIVSASYAAMRSVVDATNYSLNRLFVCVKAKHSAGAKTRYRHPTLQPAADYSAQSRPKSPESQPMPLLLRATKHSET